MVQFIQELTDETLQLRTLILDLGPETNTVVLNPDPGMASSHDFPTVVFKRAVGYNFDSLMGL